MLILSLLLACSGSPSRVTPVEAPVAPEPAPEALPEIQPVHVVDIPAGVSLLGAAGAPSADPSHDLGTFRILSTPVTVALFEQDPPAREGPVAYRTEADDKRCNLGSTRKNHPANCVNWFAARAWCEGRGLALPTEAEWEHAARAGTDTRYWWGDDWEAYRAVMCDQEPCESTMPVVREGRRCNAWGMCDVAGQVWEWTNTTWGQSPHDPGDALARDPVPEIGLMRGGSMTAPAENDVLTVGYRSDLNLNSANFYMGFRCVARGK